MRLIGIIDEDFINYKKPSMVIEFPFCNLKCDKESGESVCQNSSLLNQKIINITVDSLIERYIDNHITSAVVCQGLEPMDSFYELHFFIKTLRDNYSCNDDIVIYTGYNKEEIEEMVNILSNYKNIIFKYGRFIPNQEKHYDDILGVYLASDNQYAEILNNENNTE